MQHSHPHACITWPYVRISWSCRILTRHRGPHQNLDCGRTAPRELPSARQPSRHRTRVFGLPQHPSNQHLQLRPGLVVLLHLAKPLLDMVETGLNRLTVRSSGFQRAIQSQDSHVSHYGASSMQNTLASSVFSVSRLRMASGWRLCRVACLPVLVQVAKVLSILLN